MKFFALSLLTIVGGATSKLTHIDMVIEERPMTVVSVVPEKFTCCLTEPTRSLDQFSERINREELKGPCFFRMSRTHRGNVTDYLKKTGQILDDPKNDFTTFLVEIQAPIEVQTYIKSIHFEQKTPGTNCSSSRVSPRPTDAGKPPASQNKAEVEENPRYFRSIRPHDDETASWAIGGYRQLKGSDYLLEIPRGCLTNPTELVVSTYHIFEGAGLQAELIKGRGGFVELSKGCSVPSSRTQIGTQQEYINLIRTLPRKCGHAFEREYVWRVPESQILVEAGKTMVVAQITLDEPMLVDHQRLVMSLFLGRLKGASCAQTALYARRKGIDAEPDRRVRNLTLADDGIHVELPLELSHPIYDFRFLLLPGCTIENPRVTARVVDRKEGDESAGVGDNQN